MNHAPAATPLTGDAGNIIEVVHLGKTFGTNPVLRDIDFKVQKGEVVSIIGSSGSGKSTLLRCINLLETPTSGDILHMARASCAAVTGVGLPYPCRHGFPAVQLFNNMNVLDNCWWARSACWAANRMKHARKPWPIWKRLAWPSS